MVIVDQLFGNIYNLSFMHEEWAAMTIITSSLFIILFSTLLITKPKVKSILFLTLGMLSLLVFIISLFIEDRTYLSSLATSLMFILLSIHGFYYKDSKKNFLRFSLKFVVYVVSTLVLINYFLSPEKIYVIPGFESVSWLTAIGFLIYSSTMLSHYHDALIKNSDLQENPSIFKKSKVDFWFKVSFYLPVAIILFVSFLHILNFISTKTGLAIGLFFVCLIPFPLTYFIYKETMEWSIKLHEKNTKLILRDQDIVYHNELLQEFAQITSHNLRGPIIGLLNLSELALENETSNEIREKGFELIKEKLPALAITVESLAEFYNMIRMGEVKYEKCNIREIFEEVLIDC